MSYLLLALVTASSVYGIINLWTKDDALCVTIGNGTRTDCPKLDGTTKGVATGMIVIMLIIQLCKIIPSMFNITVTNMPYKDVTIIIRRYVFQLEEEQAYGRSSKYAMGAVPYNNSTGPSYYAHTPMQPQGGYAYAEPQNSFGRA